jgi:hypothetical protein
MSHASARRRNVRIAEALRRAELEQLANARRTCAHEFEPLWRPAPYLAAFRRRRPAPLERADMQAAAKRQAFAWLSAKLGLSVTSFDELADLAVMRRAFALIRNATIVDVAQWAGAAAMEAGCDG